MNINSCRYRIGVAIAASVLATIHAQAPPSARAMFEVASIKPSNSRPPASARAQIEYFPGGRFSATDVTLVDIIVAAFGTRRAQLKGGPDWIDSERFDIVAKGEPAGYNQDDQWRPRVRALLEDRFKLKLHLESKEMSAYALVGGKNPPKIKASKDEEPAGVFRGDDGKMTFQHVRVVGLVNTLANGLHEQVIDATNITGLFDFSVDPMQAASLGGNDESFPDLFLRAVEEQLGFKLEKRKAPIEIMVIDHAERPTAN